MLVLIGPYPPPVHGASRVAEMVAKRANEMGLPVSVRDTSVSSRRGYHFRRLARHVRVTLSLIQISRRRAVVWQTGAGGSALWYQLMVAVVARALRMDQVFHHHSFAYLNERSTAMALIVRCGGGSLRHVVLSEGMGRMLVDRYGPAQIRVLSNASLMDPVKATPKTGAAGIAIIGHLSNLSVEKGAKLVLDAVARLHADNVAVSLRLAGGTGEQDLRRRIEAHMERHSSDEWCGAIPPESVNQFMDSLDVFVFPSSYTHEALPLVVLEALQRGVPVVTTRIGCLPEVLEGTDWLCVAEAETVTATLRRLVSEPGARATAAALFDDQRRPEQFVSLLEELIPA